MQKISSQYAPDIQSNFKLNVFKSVLSKPGLIPDAHMEPRLYCLILH